MKKRPRHVYFAQIVNYLMKGAADIVLIILVLCVIVVVLTIVVAVVCVGLVAGILFFPIYRHSDAAYEKALYLYEVESAIIGVLQGARLSPTNSSGFMRFKHLFPKVSSIVLGGRGIEESASRKKHAAYSECRCTVHAILKILVEKNIVIKKEVPRDSVEKDPSSFGLVEAYRLENTTYRPGKPRKGRRIKKRLGQRNLATA